jgi:hypothetical protein
MRVYRAHAESLYALRAADLPERQNRHDRYRRLGVMVLRIKKGLALPKNDKGTRAQHVTTIKPATINPASPQFVTLSCDSLKKKTFH